MAIRATEPSPFYRLPSDDIIFGRSEAMQGLRQRVERVAGANIPVLIQGESGTGKELVARLIHQRSPWVAGPLVKVNCPAIPGTLLESELFGYEKGAFTGAYGSKPGRVELAQGGALFLDEIGDLGLDLQAKLLQLLQDGQFCRIGGQEDTRVEVRVICASNRPLEQEVENGTFRRDLFYRINVVNIELVPLRQRIEDIPDLVTYFLETHNEKYNQRARPLSVAMLRKLQSYHWPGNIRELENWMKRYVIFGTEDVLDQLLRERPQNGEGQSNFYLNYLPEIGKNTSVSLKQLTRQAVRTVERQIILSSLQVNNWNRKRTAAALQISYRALLYKIRDAGLAMGQGRDGRAAAAAGAGAGMESHAAGDD